VGGETTATSFMAGRFGFKVMMPLPPEKRVAYSGTSSMSAAQGMWHKHPATLRSPTPLPMPPMRPSASLM